MVAVDDERMDVPPSRLRRFRAREVRVFHGQAVMDVLDLIRVGR